MARFKYLNINPNGEEIGDCVTRAIALATGMNYFDVAEDLIMSADILGCDALYLCCYTHLLDDIYNFPQVECEGYTVGEFADLHPIGRYIVRMDSHLSCIIDNCIYDIWNCKDEILSRAWRVD